MKTLNYLVLLIFIGCIKINNKEPENITHQNISIIEIKEFDYSYRLKGINKLRDTILIISFKDKFYNKYRINKPTGSKEKIQCKKEYYFKLVQIKLQASTMEQLGAFIIIEKDTLWKANSYKNIPPSYKSLNTNGSFIINK